MYLSNYLNSLENGIGVNAMHIRYTLYAWQYISNILCQNDGYVVMANATKAHEQDVAGEISF